MKILSALFLLILTVNNTFAETDQATANLQEYDVNVIIFEDAHARYINSEIWNIDDTTDAELSLKETKEINKTSFKNIKPTILNKEYQRIKNSSEYNVLFYGAWRQAGLGDDEAFAINLDDLENVGRSTSENTITGNFKLILARYLHIYGELGYQRKVNIEPTPASSELANINPATGVSQINTYPITIHRRMRSKELHYIDHPLVGILIQINPVEKAKEATQ